MKNKKIIIPIIIVIAIIAIIIVVVICSNNLKATTMRLLGHEGNIDLTDETSNEISITENMQLSSGNILETQRESKGFVSLDDTKLVTLEEESCAEFEQEGKKLALNLSKGSLFFNVVEKLNDDEAFDINTASMIIGIRGTSGYVDTDENGSEALYLTSGHVHIIAKSMVTGEEQEYDMTAGQKIVVTILDDGSLDVKIEDIPETSIPMIVAEEILYYEGLLERVIEETGWSEGIIRGMANKTIENEEQMNNVGVLEIGDDMQGDSMEREDILPYERDGYIVFGAYEQDGDLTNGPEPIEWEILSIDENGMFLVSHYVLDCQPYNDDYIDVTWETCSLRSWLNNDFLNAAFTTAEQSVIKTTTVINADNPRYETSGGNNTNDKIFCLSLDEILNYYTYNSYYDDSDYGYFQQLMIPPTQYAENQGAYRYILTEDDYNEKYVYEKYTYESIGHESCWWWLRTIGGGVIDANSTVYGDGGSLNAGAVGYGGLAGASGRNPIDYRTGGVRPALYINIPEE